ncbi:MobF family relaxase [Streptomyces beijiangensis]|uniref:MobF family relaxase n=1 Tax=Streptomyces beijiangensis TaxID=163361 RepID=UPI0031D44853
MLRFTRITGGEAGLSYLLSGSGCEGAHQPEAEQGLTGPEGYYAKGTERGAPIATWIGAGVANFGLAEGEFATERDIRAIFGQHAHPAEYRAALAAAKAQIDAEGLTGTAAEKCLKEAEASARLGRKPYTYRTVEERVEDRIANEPNPEAERVAEIWKEERAKGQSAPAMYFDATFSAQKSISIYHTALEAVGRHEDAAKVLAAHHEGIKAAMEYLQTEAGYGRIGYHGQAKGDRPTTGRYLDGHAWTAAIFDHGVSREGDPQMHSHVAVLNKIKVIDEDGTEHWVTLDSRAMNKARAAAAAIYERTMEQAVERDSDVVFEQRPDGLAREIKGIDKALLDAMSTRSFQVDERYQELLEQYRTDHGREPNELMKTRLKEVATLDTRDPKRNEHQDPQARIDRAKRLAEGALEGGLDAALDKAEATGLAMRMAESGDVEWDRKKVIREAVESLQTKRATWDRSALIQQLNTTLGDQLPRDIPLTPLANELADEALKSGQYGIVQTSGLTIVEDAASCIRQSDGRSIFGPGSLGSEKFAMEEHLSTEDRVASRALQSGAPCLSPPAIDQVVKESGVSHDQADVVRGVLGDSKKISVIEGPAGAGKSFATGVIAEAWQEHTGGRVIGLGPSAVAAEVLGEQGIEIRENTTRFLMCSDGMGSAANIAKYRVQAGDMVVLDEAGMTSTDHISRIAKLVEEAGAKLVLIGDQEQLQSVEAGGLFRTMVEQGPHYSLSNVRRFRNADGAIRDWEADASLCLRRGDASALTAYDRHGLIMGGTLEEMKAATVQAYVADAVADRESVVITTTNARATELSREIRSQLVTYGLVEEHGAALADDNRAGVGDLIQARENNAMLKDSEGRLVLNRRVYRVTGVGEDGALTASRVAGRADDGTERLAGTVTLPATYVAKDVALAYAGTVNAVQGRNVGYGGYLLAEEGMSRNQVYPGLTRAQRYNRAFVACRVPADEHRLEALDQDGLSLLQSAVERDGGELSAMQELRESQDFAESLPALEPRWRHYVAQYDRHRYEGQLQQLLPPEQFARLKGEDPSTVYRALREAELAGHDGPRVLQQAITSAPMTSPAPDNVAALLNWRIDQELEGRQPEGPAVGHSWSERTPNIPGDEGRAACELAEAMDARRDVLGERLAEAPPEWAVRHLGPVPQDALERAGWAHRAGTVEGYRELFNVDAANTAIGRLPARGAVEQRAAWEAAHVALGRTDEDRTLATTSDAALRELVARYDRERSWAPAHVGEELSEARQAELRYEEKAILTQADADQTPGADQRAELEEEARGYEELVSNFSQRVEILEQIDQAREAWYEETAPAREAAEAAKDELERRGLDDQPLIEQQTPAVEESADLHAGTEPVVAYDAARLPELDWDIEGETYDQALDERLAVEANRAAPSYEEQQELDQVLAAYEHQHRAAPEVEAAQSTELDAQQPQESAQVTAEDTYVYQANPELEADIAAYGEHLRVQAVADREAEASYDAEQLPEINWEIEGPTHEQRPEQPVDEPAIEQEASAAPGVDEEYRELYEQQYAQQVSAGQERERTQPEGAEQQRETERQAAVLPELPSQLADLQEDLQQAYGALAEIAARRDARAQAAGVDEAVRAEHVEVSRTQEIEAEAPQQQIENQGPTITYGPPE